MDPLSGSITYTIGVLESRIGGSIFGILLGLWVHGPQKYVARPSGRHVVTNRRAKSLEHPCKAMSLAKPSGLVGQGMPHVGVLVHQIRCIYIYMYLVPI